MRQRRIVEVGKMATPKKRALEQPTKEWLDKQEAKQKKLQASEDLEERVASLETKLAAIESRVSSLEDI
jgi:uncharacterized protein YceH (UPF0502 family)